LGRGFLQENQKTTARERNPKKAGEGLHLRENQSKKKLTRAEKKKSVETAKPFDTEKKSAIRLEGEKTSNTLERRC